MPVLLDLCSSFRSFPPKDAIVALMVNVSAILRMVEVWKYLCVRRIVQLAIEGFKRGLND